VIVKSEAIMRDKRAAIYVRVSTDGQTVENQIIALRDLAGRRGWQILQTYADAGISGSKGREQRPALDNLLKDATRRKFDVVMAWSIDRLGRSLVDLLHTVQHLEQSGVDLFLEQQALDTTTPGGRLMFQVCGAFAEFERAMIRERVLIGLKRAVGQGKRLGRPLVNIEFEDAARRELLKGTGILKTARSVGLGTGTVQRIKREMFSPIVPSGEPAPL
jgi:DNA invertase Pin-like site-specific DNA recombinase